MIRGGPKEKVSSWELFENKKKKTKKLSLYSRMCVYSHAHTCPNLHQLIIIVKVCLFICSEVGFGSVAQATAPCLNFLSTETTGMVHTPSIVYVFSICLVVSFFWKHLTLGLVKPGSLHWARAPILAPGKLVAMTDQATYAWPAWNRA